LAIKSRESCVTCDQLSLARGTGGNRRLPMQFRLGIVMSRVFSELDRFLFEGVFRLEIGWPAVRILLHPLSGAECRHRSSYQIWAPAG